MRKFLMCSSAILLVMVALCFTASCEKDGLDGLWDPMEWESNPCVNKGEITVPAAGATIELVCKNYYPWFSGIQEGDNYIFTEYDGDHHTISGSWIRA